MLFGVPQVRFTPPSTAQTHGRFLFRAPSRLEPFWAASMSGASESRANEPRTIAINFARDHEEPRPEANLKMDVRRLRNLYPLAGGKGGGKNKMGVAVLQSTFFFWLVFKENQTGGGCQQGPNKGGRRTPSKP